jgi:hypothetical protein
VIFQYTVYSVPGQNNSDMFPTTKMKRRNVIFLLFTVISYLLPVHARAVYVSSYAQADSTTQTLVLIKGGLVKKTFDIGQRVKIKPKNSPIITGRLTGIHEEYLIIDQQKIPVTSIVWIKDKSKQDTAITVFRWIGILAGGTLLGILSFMIVFSIAYAGSGSGTMLIGLLIIGGLTWLYSTIISRKKYKLKKYELEIKELELP